MNWKGKISGMFSTKHSSELWPTTINNQIASLWHNPERITVPGDLTEVGDRVRERAIQREVDQAIYASPIMQEGANRVRVGFQGHEYTIYGFLEDTSAGQVKHVCILYPSSVFKKEGNGTYRWLVDPASLMPALHTLALVVEPSDPAFEFFYASELGPAYHLVWPTDWRFADKQLMQGVQFSPIWTPPFGIYEEGGDWHMTQTAQNDGLVKKLKMDDWNMRVRKNVEFHQLALRYLNLQCGQDLTFLQSFSQPGLVGALVKLAGENFVSLMVDLLGHYAGPCPNCGFELIKPYDASRTLDKHDVEVMHSTRKGRSAIEAGIWPLNAEWAYGTYKYVCHECRGKSQRSMFAKIMTISQIQPDLGHFFKPFTMAVEQGRAGGTT